jgi:hypothetical protein
MHLVLFCINILINYWEFRTLMKILDITWDNPLPSISINLLDNPIAEHLFNVYKHLQHVELNFTTNLRDNPFSKYHTNKILTYSKIAELGKKVNVDVNIEELPNQQYLNYLHKLYEVGYVNERKWLEFHELIHVIERLNEGIGPSEIYIDHREKGGLLTTDYNNDFNKYLDDNLTRGTCYMRWQELGKHPYEYFINNEPNDLERICALAKPWVYLKPNIFIAYYDHNATFKHIGTGGYTEFNKWFAPYKDKWKKHWNVPDWNPELMFQVIPVGKINSDDMNVLESRLKQFNYPSFVKRL